MKFNIGDLVKIGKELGHVLHEIEEPQGHVTVKLHGGRVLAIDVHDLLPGEEPAKDAEKAVATTLEAAIEKTVEKTAQKAVEKAL